MTSMFEKKMRLHFVGIGGSGMSGIAEVLLTMGYSVSGSDMRETEVTKRLEGRGAKIWYEHKGENVKGADAVVVSNAVRETNPEIFQARRAKIPVIPRAEMLNELMRLKYGVCIAGTHGKTTTTSMTGLILMKGKLDPTIVIGGVLEALGSNATMGEGEYFVVEACEAYGSFDHFDPAVAVVTNIDDDHLDHYGNMDNLKSAFVEFVNRLKFYGWAIVCGDDPVVHSILPRLERRFLTYGFSPGNDYQVSGHYQKGNENRFTLAKDGKEFGQISIGLPGRHNALNAAAAAAVGLELGVSFKDVQEALKDFKGVYRRFQVKGEAGGIKVVDDYAHHPTEVKATLSAARDLMNGQGRLVVAFQPHLYSRTQLLYAQFAEQLRGADVILLSEIYPARETPIPGVTSQLIADCFNTKGDRDVLYRPHQDDLARTALEVLQPGDLFVTLGAGTIHQVGEKVLTELQKKAGVAG